MGPIGIPEMMGIFVIALLLFGPKKLPELGRILGKGFSEFRRAKNELKSTFETHMRELERETRIEEAKSPQAKTQQAKIEPPAASYAPPNDTYSYPYDEGSPYGSTSSPHEEPVLPASPAQPATPGTIARSHGIASLAEQPSHSNSAVIAENQPRS